MQKFFVLLSAMRPYQWFKNILLFVPLLLSHQYVDLIHIQNLVITFILFGLIASSGYLINDCFDIASDKEHPIKKYRAIASGKISVIYVIYTVLFLLVISFYISSFISYTLVYVLMFYFLISFLYSYYLKKIVLVDVFVLAFLYTIRIITGSIIINVELSFWLLAFSVFFFLSLALVKRVSELLNLDNKEKSLGRGYCYNDANILMIQGVVLGFVSVVIMAFYINSDTISINYQNPILIWIIIPLLLYWISYIWLTTFRGNMNEDPVYFAIKDKNSWVIFILIILLILISRW